MSRYRVKNGTLSAQDEGVDSVGNTNMASSVTPTLAVHHRCITPTAFGGVSRIRRPKRSRMLKPKTAAQDTPCNCAQVESRSPSLPTSVRICAVLSDALPAWTPCAWCLDALCMVLPPVTQQLVVAAAFSRVRKPGAVRMVRSLHAGCSLIERGPRGSSRAAGAREFASRRSRNLDSTLRRGFSAHVSVDCCATSALPALGATRAPSI